MQAKDFRVVNTGNSRDVLVVLLDLADLARRNFVAEAFTYTARPALIGDFRKVVLVPEDGFLEVILTVGIEEFAVEVVSDTSTILNLTDHVADDRHVDVKVG